MGDKNQILDFGGETLNAIVPANFDVSAVVLDKAKIEEHLDLLLGNPNDIRKLTVNNIDQCVIANKVNYAYEQLANESFLNNAVSNLDLETSIYSLLVTYIDSNLIRQDKPKLAIKSKERKRVLDLLFSLPIKKLNVSNLASESYLSVRKLHYLCISSWGRTPNQMIINARYRKINTFLENGDFQNKPFIGRILQGCGITNISRFNRHYASIFGETPLKTLKK
jgi:AraC-like DNA-binding protein